MAFTDDLLEGMEDAKQVSTKPAAAPGDLNALAAVAARLNASQKESEGGQRRRRQNSPLREAVAEPPQQQAPPSHSSGPRRTNAALPHDLWFTVPPNCRPGQPVCVQGPHGPLRMPLPQGYQPGERCKVRFGPSEMHQVVVPAGKKPGDLVRFPGPHDEDFQAPVPPGKEPGDVFEVTPPVMMVQVPSGSQPGDVVCFIAADGLQRETAIPRGVQEGQYFPCLFGTKPSNEVSESGKESQHCLKEEPPLIDLLDF